MDRKRHFAALTGLGAVQRLQVAAARAELADAMDALATKEEAAEASRRQLQTSERYYEDVLAAASFDPDAMRRAGLAILVAEDRLAETRDARHQAEAAEGAARAEWHGHRLRARAIGEHRRRMHRKLVQTAEDKAAVDLIALAASKEAAR
ncbi:hypothetical protein ATE62_04340 [Sphingopyxis sp. HIX]|uniref:hypothetical protein n=2 Tax=unclassified Sphingopyxis TaxID=2614943 RepID=UPI0007372275|nr:hypothetical protein [Sphingopyxis sp. HIX]KTE42950.1 hypothetical protein ATE62_04340 [Sphingopyxis sp. HIX]KTE85224.1 hypothetical protein ATE72_05025 [Sphingopyxis sp. HXXIV]